VEFEFRGRRPQVHADAYIAPTAVLIGDVEVAAGTSVWFGAVLRGDEAAIKVGEGSNVQDNAVIHCARDLPTVIERDATIGHSAQLEGCVVEAGALVGMGATMLQRSRLGAGSMLAAGVPASVRKELDGSSRSWVDSSARHYRERAIAYRSELRIARP